MNFAETVAANPLVLTECAVAERLRRRLDISLHPTLFNTPLIYDKAGIAAMREIYGQYREIARESGLPVLLCAPTWRVDRQRIEAAGLERGLVRDAVAFMQGLRSDWHEAASPVFVGGLIGPANDCYQPSQSLDSASAERYHAWQVEELATAGVDCVVAQTIPAVGEAIGMARVLSRTGISSFISFVIDRSGRVLDGTPLAEAIERVDQSVPRAPAGYMVNCVHPLFLDAAAQPPALFDRLCGIQANASSLSHDELDGSQTLQQDSLDEWGRLMLELNREYGVTILGGCCGTDDAYLRYLANH